MASGVSVRALASPAFVLALALLILNDQLLKRAYPGVITGKLSDLAGLVVAPLVLAVLLTAWRVRRPMPTAIALTGLGFTLTKASATGAAAASALWSLAGVPTLIHADVTDLLALPALYAAWLVHRQASGRPLDGWRPALARATGIALLPVAVLASAATSCQPDEGRTSLTVLNAHFPGGQPGREDRLMAMSSSVIDGSGAFTRLENGSLDSVAGEGGEFDDTVACDEERTCWRIDPTFDSVPSVQISTDGGRTWHRDLWVSPEDRDAALAGEEESCGTPTARLRSIRVLRGGTTVKVAVAASRAGVYVRTAGGTWSLFDEEGFRAPDSAPSVRLRGRVFAVAPRQPEHSPRPSDEPPYPGEEESLPPEPT